MREPIPTDVAASITSGRPRVAASSRSARYRCRSGWAPTGPPAGLYHVGTVRGQPATVAPEQPAARFSGGTPHRQGAIDEPAGLRSMWPAHVRQLSEQVDRLLRVYAEEERGIDVLRTRSRGGGRSRGPAGFACLGACHLGAQPESDPGRAQGARPSAPPLEAPPGAGHL